MTGGDRSFAVAIGLTFWLVIGAIWIWISFGLEVAVCENESPCDHTVLDLAQAISIGGALAAFTAYLAFIDDRGKLAGRLFALALVALVVSVSLWINA
jgi:hypothetical protein